MHSKQLSTFQSDSPFTIPSGGKGLGTFISLANAIPIMILLEFQIRSSFNCKVDTLRNAQLKNAVMFVTKTQG